MRFHTNHSIHAVSFLRSEGVDRYGRKISVALKSRAYHARLLADPTARKRADPDVRLFRGYKPDLLSREKGQLASGASRRYRVVTTERRWVEATNPSRMWALGAEGASSATGYLRS
jgi:hypothetical protein